MNAVTPLFAPFTGLAFWGLVLAMVVADRGARYVSALPVLSMVGRSEVSASERWNVKRGTRNVATIAVSLGLLSVVQTEPPLTLSLLAALVLLVFVVSRRLLAAPAGSSRLLAAGCILLVIVFFALSRYSVLRLLVTGALGGRPPLPPGSLINILGISYFSFKLIHVLVDCSKKKIAKIDFLTFANYAFYFPSYFSGPINRYQDFAADVDNVSPRVDLVNGIRRIIDGLFKKLVLASLLLPYAVTSLDLGGTSATGIRLLVGIYCYMLFVYCDFSGYSDMAIGTSALLGIRLPENFDNPFFRRNLQRFWASWHMSLTGWLTDYIYWPLARRGRRFRFFRDNPVTSSCVWIVATFLVCGLWHGNGVHFLLWGLYHGLGLAALNAYGALRKRLFPEWWKRQVTGSRWALFASGLFTLQYVAFGFLLFACDMTDVRRALSVLLGAWISR